MTNRIQDFFFKWSVAAVVFAGIELGVVARPALGEMFAAIAG